MTDTTYALFNRTWLLHCDLCDDRVRLGADTTDAADWQTFINRWKAEHHGHVYLDSAPCGAGPGTAAVATATLNSCGDRRATKHDNQPKEQR